jgi:hypothetical protein
VNLHQAAPLNLGTDDALKKTGNGEKTDAEDDEDSTAGKVFIVDQSYI